MVICLDIFFIEWWKEGRGIRIVLELDRYSIILLMFSIYKNAFIMKYTKYILIKL